MQKLFRSFALLLLFTPFATAATYYNSAFCLDWEPNPQSVSPDIRSQWRVQIATAPTFAKASRVVDDTIAGVITWYPANDKLTPGKYYWRVGLCRENEQTPKRWQPTQELTIAAAKLFRVPLTNDWREVEKVLQKAAKNTPARLLFSPGEYDFTAEGATPPPAEGKFLRFTAVKDLTVDGNNAKVILPPSVGILLLEQCERVLVKNFFVDYNPAPHIGLQVETVDPKAGTVDAEVLAGYSLPTDYQAYDREKKSLLVTASENYAIKRDAPLLLIHKGFTAINPEKTPRRFRFQFEPRLLRYFTPGDILVLDPRWQKAGGGTTVCSLGGCDIFVRNLQIYAATNECLNSFYTNRLVYQKVELLRRSDRILGVNNGGNNHHNARLGPWIEGCTFENCGDDVCHTNGYAMAIDQLAGEKRLRVNKHQPYDQYGKEMQLDLQSGDTVEFYNRGEKKYLGARKIVSVQNDTNPQYLLVELDAQVAGLTPGPLRGGKQKDVAQKNNSVTRMFNRSRGCNEFVFRGNTCKYSRRVGALVKGSGGWITGNLFEELGGGGVEFWNAPYEGLGGSDYVVTNNTIRNCCRVLREDAPIWVVTFPKNGAKLHDNLRIEGNKIDARNLPAVWVNGAKKVVIRNNEVRSLQEGKFLPAPEKEAILRENCP